MIYQQTVDFSGIEQPSPPARLWMYSWLEYANRALWGAFAKVALSLNTPKDNKYDKQQMCHTGWNPNSVRHGLVHAFISDVLAVMGRGGSKCLPIDETRQPLCCFKLPVWKWTSLLFFYCNAALTLEVTRSSALLSLACVFKVRLINHVTSRPPMRRGQRQCPSSLHCECKDVLHL